MSNSSGNFGPDAWLYITGHDALELYVVKLPSTGNTVVWVAATHAGGIAGQGVAWDRSHGKDGYLNGIYRGEARVVERAHHFRIASRV